MMNYVSSVNINGIDGARNEKKIIKNHPILSII
jgi:hypothetical protein